MARLVKHLSLIVNDLRRRSQENPDHARKVVGRKFFILSKAKVYANAGECGDFLAEAFSGSAKVYSHGYGEFCGGTAGEWTTIGYIPLDGSDYPGGITRVWIQVVDKLHDGLGYADCHRSDSTCLQDQG